MRLPFGPVEIIPCNSVGTAPAAPGCWPTRPKLRTSFGAAGFERSYTCVMRRMRQSGNPETTYAIPESHSHQFLCVPLSPFDSVETSEGFVGSVTSHTSCARL